MNRRFLLGLCLAVLAPACLAGEWFLLSGDGDGIGPQAADTAELDISTVGRKADTRSFRFRVNLAETRSDEAGHPYRSYLSLITVVCSTRSVFHDEQTRYRDAGWTGPARTEVFPQPRPMAFGGLDPDPRARLLAAACR